ncbi:Epoxyqueuosine (oQ) reductase QueG [Minicystis rosea]|nr:Epoxyqueuosine (oQ) reductase QueG [Minicystis rosea]
MTAATTDPTTLVKERAHALGFDIVGIARADEPLGVEHERYRAFVDRGMHGSLGWLADHAAVRRRLDGAEILAGAKSVVCVGRRYARTAAEEAQDPPLARGIARYARGQDYHVFLRKKLRKLAAFVRGLGPEVEARAFLDTEPVLERAWAARAGIGFVGKNGLVITPGQGSYQILGEVVTTLALVPDVPIAERCGSCTRCLDACPTQAFPEPFVLDARRCISYWTIEEAGAPPDDLKAAIGEHLFGCDVCQEVCPFNRTAPPSAEKTVPFRPLERWGTLDLASLVTLPAERWEEVAEGSPMYRARQSGVARNAALVAANRLARGQGGDDERRAVEAAREHADPIVRATVKRSG